MGPRRPLAEMQIAARIMVVMMVLVIMIVRMVMVVVVVVRMVVVMRMRVTMLMLVLFGLGLVAATTHRTHHSTSNSLIRISSPPQTWSFSPPHSGQDA